LEHLVEGSKSMPLTHHKIVDEDAFFVLTQRLKNALPEDIKKATELARKTASVVENANSEAKRMVTDAQNEAQHLVGDALECPIDVVAVPDDPGPTVCTHQAAP